MRLSELEFHLEDFLLACQSKNLSPKTLSSYEQSLKLFLAYLKAEPEVDRCTKGQGRSYRSICGLCPRVRKIHRSQ
jgi:integrase/recombinase XerD